jgi:hypothetical protein
MMPEQLMLGGPFLAVAVLCEKILEDKEGVHSLIRIVDRFNVQGQSPRMSPTVLSPMLALLLKAGIFRGPATLQIQPITPSGEPRPALSLPVNFEGDDDRGVFLGLQLQFLATEPGLYWFEVRLLEPTPIALTRIPMRVVYLPLPSIVPGGQPS